MLCTHLHVDHVGWNTRLVDGRWVPTFPNARYVFARTELDSWERGGNPKFSRAALEDSVLPVIAAGKAQIVDDGFTLDDQISLEPTPGHTLGHVAIRLASGGSARSCAATSCTRRSNACTPSGPPGPTGTQTSPRGPGAPSLSAIARPTRWSAPPTSHCPRSGASSRRATPSASSRTTRDGDAGPPGRRAPRPTPGEELLTSSLTCAIQRSPTPTQASLRGLQPSRRARVAAVFADNGAVSSFVGCFHQLQLPRRRHPPLISQLRPARQRGKLRGQCAVLAAT